MVVVYLYFSQVTTMAAIAWKFFLLSTFLVDLGDASDRELTVSVEPGTQECFYVDLKSGQILDVEYQVIDGGQGDLDIDFRLVSPSERLILSESRKRDGSHRQAMSEAGDYEVCFDNTFSIYSAKIVFFEIIVENDGDEASNELWGDEDALGDLAPEEVYEIQIKEIQDAVYRVRDNLGRAEQFQQQIRSHEARDRNVAENNFTRVNTWSVIHLSVMVLSGILQVVLVRSLFDEKSRVHQLWKKVGSNLGS